MMLATYVHDLSPFLVRFGESLGIRWYGLAYVVSFLLGYLLYVHLARRGYSDLTPSQVGDFITITALFGVIVGGRLGYVLFYQFDFYKDNPLNIFKIWTGGMSSHGGIIGIAIFLSLYSWWLKVSWTNLGDNLVCVAPIGLGIVRLANFINGELYGRVTSVAWGMKFPRELVEKPSAAALQMWTDTQRESLVAQAYADPKVRDMIAPYLEIRHPSQFYEAFFEGAVLFTILWIMRTRYRVPNGVLTGTFFIVYAIFRIGCEFFREPDAPLAGPFTRGQFLSFFMIFIGIGFLVSAYRRNDYPHPPKGVALAPNLVR